MAHHDYICSVCAASFSREDSPDAAPVVCPGCGSPLVREGWESRLRNAAGKGPPRPIQEMRDKVG